MQWIVKKTLNKIESKNDNKYYSKLKANQKSLLQKAIDISNSKKPTDIYISPLQKESRDLVTRTVSTYTNDSCFYSYPKPNLRIN